MTTLEAENIDLRNKLVEESALRVKAELENAKLRECLQEIAKTINSGFGIDYGWMLSHIRALGIEVDA